MRFKIILLFFVFLISDLRAHPKKLIRLPVLESLTNGSVFSTYQDGLGAMWLSTNYGLYRFNGTSLEYIKGPLPMKSICGNGANLIYTATYDAICRFDINDNTEQILSDDRIEFHTCAMAAKGDSLWIASHNRIYLQSGTQIVLFQSLPDDKADISSLIIDRAGNLLAGTHRNGLFAIGPSGQMSHISSIEGDISALFIDSEQRLWVGTLDNGAFRLDATYRNDVHLSTIPNRLGRLSSNLVRAFCEDAGHAIWIGTMNGVNIFAGEQIRQESCSGVVSEPSVWCLASDNQGGVWMGTFYDGVYYYDDANPFVSVSLPKERDMRLFNAMVEDIRGNIWILTDNYGMFRMSHDNTRVSHIAGSDRYKFKSAYYNPREDAIWIGTYMGGLKRYDIQRNRWSEFGFAQENGEELKVAVNDIKSYDGQLYLGTTSGVIVFDPQSESKISRRLPGYNGMVYSLAVDQRNRLWIGGLGLYIHDLKSGTTQPYHHRSDNNDDRLNFIKLFCDTQNVIWAASLGEGFFRIDDSSEACFGRENIGLADNFTSFIGAITDDILLIGTNSGLSIFDTAHNRCYNYNQGNGLGITSARSGCVLQKSSGEVLIGGMDGIVSLDPTDLNFRYDNIDIEFDRLKINNRNITTASPEQILHQTLPFTQEITLKHSQTNLSFELASFDFSKPYPIFYEYKLDGCDTEWTPFSINQPITYMNLAPNDYRLKVRATLNKSGSDYKQIEIGIHVKAAWYATTLAKSCYVLLTLLVAFGVFYFAYSKMLFKQMFHQKERENLERMRFFINISHEIRTPLTLIIGQIELFLKSHKNQDKENENIVSTYNNARRMQQIVSNLLDFEKQNQGYTRICVAPTNLVDFTHEIEEAFAQYAAYREIRFAVRVLGEIPMLMLDRSQMQRVFSNLLINAFKYTPDSGSIEIRIEPTWSATTKEGVQITFADSGRGIAAEALPRIFDPFYQDTSGLSCDRHNHGTGIGLALSKGIVELHHGTIRATSAQGQGATFTVTLPAGEQWYKGDINITTERTSTPNATGIEVVEAIVPELQHATESESGGTKMLLVEDDNDLRAMLKSIFKHAYTVLEADNGVSGFDLALQHQPDIIISDVIMPEMDGYTLCAKLKDDFHTCHIPVILLTARSGTQHSVEGINVGADDYITKPFNIELLEARCTNLLNNRKRLQKKYSTSESIHEQITTNDKDSQFINSVIEVIERNLFTHGLNVTMLCGELSLGKTLLSVKIKGITGYAPGEFIEVIRLKKAATMLRARDMAISEIAYDLGFSSPKYFSIRFKKLFGKSPTAFLEEETELTSSGDAS